MHITKKRLLLFAAIGILPIAARAQSGAFVLPFARQSDQEPFNTKRTSVAVDAAGGVHVAYVASDSSRPAFYAYCSANCGSASNWSYTNIGNRAWWLNLALDADGRPRLLLASASAADGRGYNTDYSYAVCDRGCTDAGNWKITLLTKTVNILTENSHFFALDRQGRPRFVFSEKDNREDPSQNGTFYAFCDRDCASADNWLASKIADDTLDLASLALTAGGQPRLAFSVWAAASGRDAGMNSVGYLECDTYCENGSVMLMFERNSLATNPGRGPDEMFRLRLDSDDRPRMVFFSSSSLETRPFKPGQLYYLWCNQACADPDNNTWRFSGVGAGDDRGYGPDLVLDKLNRPRVAYATMGKGLGYSQCTADCESDQPKWDHQFLDLASGLNATWYPAGQQCSFSTWIAEHNPSLALDGDGNPRIGLDAIHFESGVDSRNISCRVINDLRLAAFTMFDR